MKTHTSMQRARAAGRTELPSAQTMIFAPVAGGLDRLVSVPRRGAGPFWPFVAKVPDRAKPSDPVNLIFRGSDARGIRAALKGLDAERDNSRVPPGVAPDARWSDAMGALQIAWSSGSGWTGSVIQLELGSYEGVRVHLRLFDVEDSVLANAHVDFRVPGTAEHAVVAWDAAADLVRHELERAGLLAAAAEESARITPGPYRSIDAALIEELPDDLVHWLALPTTPSVGVTASAEGRAGVPIPSSGTARILELGPTPPTRPGVWTREIDVPVDYTLLKPFCRSTDDEWVHLEGILKLSQRVIEGAGRFSSSFTAQGLLEVTPVGAEDRNPEGIPYAARVSERYLGLIDDGGPRASLVKEHSEFLATGKPGETRASTERLLVEPGREPEYWVRQRC